MKLSDQEKFFETWLAHHRGILVKIATSFAETSADRDDLLQELALAMWQSIPGFCDQSKVSTYIYRVTLNRAISWNRTRRSYFKRITAFQDSQPESSHEKHHAEQNDEINLLYKHIRKLREADRSIILLCLDDLSYKEISDITGISVNNVGVRLSRIKVKLSDSIRKEQQ